MAIEHAAAVGLLGQPLDRLGLASFQQLRTAEELKVSETGYEKDGDGEDKGTENPLA